MIYAIYALVALSVCSIIWNVILVLKIRKTPVISSAAVTRSQTAEELLAEMLNNGSAQIAVYPGAEFYMRSPRG